MRGGRLDLFDLPGLGRFLRWRHARTSVQIVTLATAAVLVLDGLFGPDLAARNLSGVVPWVHWRAGVVLTLLFLGNAFCFACPFMLPRRLAKRWFGGDRPWPSALRGKWLALLLLALFFWSYEAFDLWASPWVTAWLILAYFASAFAVDAVFRGAAFCKHLCPIGQFHFVHSTASPFEVAVRDPGVCAACATKDCIRGRWEVDPAATPTGAPPTTTIAATAGPHHARTGRPLDAGADGRLRLVQNGCELWLYQPRKRGNLDCTFCLECVHACPWDNIGILSRRPAEELSDDTRRSGIGRLTERPDFAVLALFLVFAAFSNAFGMVSPVYSAGAWIADLLGIRSPLLVDGLLFTLSTLAIPTLLVGGAAAWTAAARPGAVRRERMGGRMLATVGRWGWSLVPIGFAMWIAHYLFHFLVGGASIVPVTQDWLAGVGLPSGGAPRWGWAAIAPESWIFPLQLLLLELGMLISWGVAWRLSAGDTLPRSTFGRIGIALPWMALAALLSIWGIWLLAQPMEMRGTLMMGG